MISSFVQLLRDIQCSVQGIKLSSATETPRNLDRKLEEIENKLCYVIVIMTRYQNGCMLPESVRKGPPFDWTFDDAASTPSASPARFEEGDNDDDFHDAASLPAEGTKPWELSVVKEEPPLMSSVTKIEDGANDSWNDTGFVDGFNGSSSPSDGDANEKQISASSKGNALAAPPTPSVGETRNDANDPTPLVVKRRKKKRKKTKRRDEENEESEGSTDDEPKTKFIAATDHHVKSESETEMAEPLKRFLNINFDEFFKAGNYTEASSELSEEEDGKENCKGGGSGGGGGDDSSLKNGNENRVAVEYGDSTGEVTGITRRESSSLWPLNSVVAEKAEVDPSFQDGGAVETKDGVKKMASEEPRVADSQTALPTIVPETSVADNESNVRIKMEDPLTNELHMVIENEDSQSDTTLFSMSFPCSGSEASTRQNTSNFDQARCVQPPSSSPVVFRREKSLSPSEESPVTFPSFLLQPSDDSRRDAAGEHPDNSLSAVESGVGTPETWLREEDDSADVANYGTWHIVREESVGLPSAGGGESSSTGSSSTRKKKKRRKVYPCSQCTLTFASKSSLRIHQKFDVHDASSREEEESVEGAVEAVTAEEGDDRESMIVDVEENDVGDVNEMDDSVVHSASKGVVDCAEEWPPLSGQDELDFSSLDKPDLERPVKPKKKTHKCNDCGKTFSTTGNLNVHYRAIHGGQKLMCGICDRGFAYIYSLKLHMESIHGGRRFPCGECDKDFAYASALKTHEAAVHRGRKFPCKFCKKEFTHSGDVTAHIESLHYGRRFPCKFCVDQKKVFTHRVNLRKHLKDEHGIHPKTSQKMTFQKTYEPSLGPAKLDFEAKMEVAAATAAAMLSQETPMSTTLTDAEEGEKAARNKLPNQRYLCVVCRDEFKAVSALRSHMEMRHPDFVSRPQNGTKTSLSIIQSSKK